MDRRSHKLDEQKQTVDLLINSVLCIMVREGAWIMQERFYLLSNLFFETVELHKDALTRFKGSIHVHVLYNAIYSVVLKEFQYLLVLFS